MRIVVTGASGFLGRELVFRLRRDGHDVLALCRSSCADGIRIDDYANAPVGDVLVHLAQESDRSRCEESGDAGVEKAGALLQALLNKPYQRIVYASSAVLYGDEGVSAHIPTDALHVNGVYSRTKYRSELAVQATGHGVVARLSNLYGKDMASTNVLSRILEQIPGNGVVEIMDDTPVRDFLWVQDAAAGLAAMALGTRVGTYNLGTGVATSIGDLARLALDVAGQVERPVCAISPSQHPSHLLVDISATTVDWNWRPTITLREGLQRLLTLKQASA